MDFREATDKLLAAGVGLREIADAAGVSLNSIARARVREGQRRPPPRNWPALVRALAEARAVALRRLADELHSVRLEQ